MLSVKNYPADYVDACQTRLEHQLDTWQALDVAGDEAAEAFTVDFHNNLILVLEHSFVHRMRGNEGKGGNPLNEVRRLADSILNNHAMLAGEKSIKYKPETSVTGLAVGDQIALTSDKLRALAIAYFATIRDKYPPS